MSGKKPISIDLRQLEYFVALADVGTISGAASRLGITQPSLSEALAKLENQLDIQLVVRGARGTNLTEAGAALAKYGHDILKGIDLALEEVRHLGGEARGLVSVGLIQGIAMLLSVPLTETVQIELPLVKLRLSEGASGHVLEWLASGKIDLAIIGHGRDDHDLESRPLLEEELFLISAPDNWPPPGSTIAPGQPIEFKDLKDLPLVLPAPQHGLREFVERFARSNSIQINVTVEMDSLRQIATLVSRASAYSIMSHASVMNEVSKGELVIVPIIKPVMRRTAHIIRKRSRPVTRASASVERLISVILKEMIKRYGLSAKLAD